MNHKSISELIKQNTRYCQEACMRYQDPNRRKTANYNQKLNGLGRQMLAIILSYIWSNPITSLDLLAIIIKGEIETRRCQAPSRM